MPDDQLSTPAAQNPSPRASGKNSLGIPIAIVIAAALVAGAIYLSGGKGPNPQANTQINTDVEQQTPEIDVQPVTEDDHIRGNPNADILLVEYSDYDCPFCARFHETLNQIMDEYGAGGRVAWVYRHFPLQQLHPNAPRLAVAAECVAEQGGNDAFWTFTDLVFDREVNVSTDLSKLPEFAQTAGVDPVAFEECLNSDRYNEQISGDVEEAIAAGGRGTPHTIVLVGDQHGTISGAQEFSAVKQIIDTLLSQIDGEQQ